LRNRQKEYYLEPGGISQTKLMLSSLKIEDIHVLGNNKLFITAELQ